MKPNGFDATGEEWKQKNGIEFRADQKLYDFEQDVENNARGGRHLIDTVACRATRRIILVLVI